MPTAELPDRALLKAPEVCEIAKLQPYVLRSWEAEFPDLGVTRAGASGRVYRRHDLERVLRLKHLLFVEGLTLAGARRRLEEEREPLPDPEEPAPTPTRRGGNGAQPEQALRRQLTQVRQGLRALLELLEARKNEPPAFELHAGSSSEPATKGARPASAARKKGPPQSAAKTKGPKRRSR